MQEKEIGDGNTIDLSRADHRIDLHGFSIVEPDGCWTNGESGRIDLPISPEWSSEILVNIELRPFIRPEIGHQTIELRTNTGVQKKFDFFRHLESASIEFNVAISKNVLHDRLEIHFDVEYPGQPSKYEMWPDDRHLGVMVRRIHISSSPPASAGAENPYRNLPAHQFWRKAISAIETHEVDPVTKTRFKISADARVGTAGSCFAQHISRRIMGAGFKYFVTEDGAGLPADRRAAGNYGTFSARYGNIYTAMQLLQLHEEAFGERVPAERAWQRLDGRYIDPFRQQIQPEGFESVQAVLDERQKHLGAVRKLLENVEIFVFTLGLTEAWRSKEDGSVFSAAPGVVGGSYDASRYEFVNFDLEQTYGALSAFLHRFHGINPTAKVLLTVSPVPLIATYEPRSVLVSTVYSKSVLRVAADMALKQFDWVDYFPSYEIITGSFSGGLYYESDWREVNSVGVSHAMRCFMNNYLVGKHGRRDKVPDFEMGKSMSGVVCDEEVMDRARG